MRLVVISLGLGLLLYGLAQEMQTPPALAMVGFLLITSSLCSRFLGRLGISPASSAIFTGLLVGFGPVKSSQWVALLHPFSEFAFAWVGLGIGLALTQSILKNKRLLLSAGVLYALPLILTYPGLLAWGMPSLPAARLAILSGISAPLFISGRKTPSESLPLSLLVTALGLLLWALTGLPSGLPFADHSLWAAIVDLFFFGIGIEAAFRILKIARTHRSRAVALSFIALLLAMAAWARDLHPLPIALLGGTALSFRGAKALSPITDTPYSQLIGTFALAAFGLQLYLGKGLDTAWTIWPPLLLYGIASTAGKIAGGVIANRKLHLPSGCWLPLLPQGFLALVCFTSMTTAGALNATATTHLIFFAFFCLVMPVATTLTQWGIQKWKNGRHADHAARPAV